MMESGTGDASRNKDLEDIAYTLAMHSAAMKPGYLNKTDVPEEVLNEAREEAKA